MLPEGEFEPGYGGQHQIDALSAGAVAQAEGEGCSHTAHFGTNLLFFYHLIRR